MKRTVLLVVAALFTASVMLAGELSEADLKWKSAVDKMIQNGVAEISTPSATRVGIVKELAAKYGRKVQVAQTANNSFRVKLSASDVAVK